MISFDTLIRETACAASTPVVATTTVNTATTTAPPLTISSQHTNNDDWVSLEVVSFPPSQGSQPDQRADETESDTPRSQRPHATFITALFNDAASASSQASDRALPSQSQPRSSQSPAVETIAAAAAAKPATKQPTNEFELNTLKRLEAHQAPIRAMCFDQTGAYCFTGSDDRLIHAWCLASGELKATLRAHEGRVNCLDVCAENTVLASCSQVNYNSLLRIDEY